jgi:hypothetical protein
MKRNNIYFLYLVPVWAFGIWFGILFPIIVRGWNFFAAFLLMFAVFALSFLLGVFPFMTGKLPRDRANLYLVAIPIASGVIGVLLGGILEDI